MIRALAIGLGCGLVLTATLAGMFLKGCPLVDWACEHDTLHHF